MVQQEYSFNDHQFSIACQLSWDNKLLFTLTDIGVFNVYNINDLSVID